MAWRTVEQDLRRIHPRYSVDGALNDAQNRGQWRGLIRDLIAAPKLGRSSSDADGI